jgi:HD-like signal output (HDOD) protein
MYSNPEQAKKTLATLKEVITRKGDFPSISGSVSQIVKAMRETDTADFNLAQSVLSDFALTQKVIRLANSAMYSAFGGSITTVSRAIYVLGTETVGHLALGLKFIDQLDKAAGNNEQARAEFTKAMVAGTIARKVTENMSSRDTEESVVCTLLHNLGRLLVSFYLPTEWETIQARVNTQGSGAEAAAAEAVLGLSLHDLGREMAVQWGLPAEVTDAMRPAVPAGDHPLSHADWLASLANFSSECSKVVADGDGDTSQVMKDLAKTYAPSLGLEIDVLSAAAAAVEKDEECQRLMASHKAGTTAKSSEKPLDAYNLLDNGLRDMAAISETADVSTLAGLMIEAMHSSMGFRRVYVFLRNGATKQVTAKMALGLGARDIMTKLTFSEAFEPDVFHFSLAQNRPVFIENCRLPNIQAKLPVWFKRNLAATRSFVCVPIVANNVPVGLVYGDWESEDSELRVEAHELTKIVKMRDILLSALQRRKS